MDATVSVGIAHGDVDAVVGISFRQGAEGWYQQAFVGEDDGCALGVGEPVGVARQQLSGVLAL